MAQVSLITGVAAMTCITGYHTRKGVRPMVSRLRMMCLGLGILSTVIACAVAPPAMPPPTVAPPPVILSPATPSPAAPPATPPPADLPQAVAPPLYIHLPSTTGNRGPDTSQRSPYERKMDEEELEYRRQRSAKEREQELQHQQWEQERARERDPRYEWMR